MFHKNITTCFHVHLEGEKNETNAFYTTFLAEEINTQNKINSKCNNTNAK